MLNLFFLKLNIFENIFKLDLKIGLNIVSQRLLLDSLTQKPNILVCTDLSVLEGPCTFYICLYDFDLHAIHLVFLNKSLVSCSAFSVEDLTSKL